MKDYLKLLRVKHYIKNFLVFVPLFFGGEMLSISKMGTACLGCLAFSTISSAIYILNDLQDIERDRKHPTKCKRPLASGRIKKESSIGNAGSLHLFCSDDLCVTWKSDERHLSGSVFCVECGI